MSRWLFGGAGFLDLGDFERRMEDVRLQKKAQDEELEMQRLKEDAIRDSNMYSSEMFNLTRGSELSESGLSEYDATTDLASERSKESSTETGSIVYESADRHLDDDRRRMLALEAGFGGFGKKYWFEGTQRKYVFRDDEMAIPINDVLRSKTALGYVPVLSVPKSPSKKKKRASTAMGRKQPAKGVFVKGEEFGPNLSMPNMRSTVGELEPIIIDKVSEDAQDYDDIPVETGELEAISAGGVFMGEGEGAPLPVSEEGSATKISLPSLGVETKRSVDEFGIENVETQSTVTEEDESDGTKRKMARKKSVFRQRGLETLLKRQSITTPHFDCKGNTMFFGQATSKKTPIINRIEPNRGSCLGSRIEVQGLFFSRDHTQVQIGGELGRDIIVLSDNRVVLTTPAKPLPGEYPLQVISMGVESRVTERTTYKYVGPRVTSVEPKIGPPEGGTEVTIEVKNTSDHEDDMLVIIGCQVCNIRIEGTNRTIKAIVPEAPTYLQSMVKVAVFMKVMDKWIQAETAPGGIFYHYYEELEDNTVSGIEWKRERKVKRHDGSHAIAMDIIDLYEDYAQYEEEYPLIQELFKENLATLRNIFYRCALDDHNTETEILSKKGFNQFVNKVGLTKATKAGSEDTIGFVEIEQIYRKTERSVAEGDESRKVVLAVETLELIEQEKRRKEEEAQAALEAEASAEGDEAAPPESVSAQETKKTEADSKDGDAAETEANDDENEIIPIEADRTPGLSFYQFLAALVRFSSIIYDSDYSLADRTSLLLSDFIFPKAESISDQEEFMAVLLCREVQNIFADLEADAKAIFNQFCQADQTDDAAVFDNTMNFSEFEMFLKDRGIYDEGFLDVSTAKRVFQLSNFGEYVYTTCLCEGFCECHEGYVCSQKKSIEEQVFDQATESTFEEFEEIIARLAVMWNDEKIRHLAPGHQNLDMPLEQVVERFIRDYVLYDAKGRARERARLREVEAQAERLQADRDFELKKILGIQDISFLKENRRAPSRRRMNTSSRGEHLPPLDTHAQTQSSISGPGNVLRRKSSTLRAL